MAIIRFMNVFTWCCFLAGVLAPTWTNSPEFSSPLLIGTAIFYKLVCMDAKERAMAITETKKGRDGP